MYIKTRIILGFSCLIVMSNAAIFSGSATGNNQLYNRQSNSGQMKLQSITLNKPGNYMLVGIEDFENTPLNTTATVIAVKTDAPVLVGNGQYNITMHNVNINLSNRANYYDISGFNVATNSNINLTLVGENSIVGGDGACGLRSLGSVTVTKKSTGSLQIYSEVRAAILARNITVDSGDIVAKGGCFGIFGVENLIINGGNITTSGHRDSPLTKISGLHSNSNIAITGGIVNGILYSAKKPQ